MNAEAGSTITVRDSANNIIGTAGPVDATGTIVVNLTRSLSSGESISATAKNGDKLTSDAVGCVVQDLTFNPDDLTDLTLVVNKTVFFENESLPMATNNHTVSGKDSNNLTANLNPTDYNLKLGATDVTGENRAGTDITLSLSDDGKELMASKGTIDSNKVAITVLPEVREDEPADPNIKPLYVEIKFQADNTNYSIAKTKYFVKKGIEWSNIKTK